MIDPSRINLIRLLSICQSVFLAGSLQAAIVLGPTALEALANEYLAKGKQAEATGEEDGGSDWLFAAAKVRLAEVRVSDSSAASSKVKALMEEAHTLIERSGRLETREGQQLDLEVLKVLEWTLNILAGTESPAYQAIIPQVTRLYQNCHLLTRPFCLSLR